jgi:glycine reductase complex component B subunit gamma
MTEPKRIVHYLNQFFGGIGGEEKAGTPVELRSGPVGPGLALQQALGADARIVATIICGDNYFAEHRDAALGEVMKHLRELGADALVAGPAFHAGRYGLACGEVGKAALAQLELPAVTGMYPENPGAEFAKAGVYIVPTAASAAGMREAVQRIAGLVSKLCRGEAIGPAQAEGYLPRGGRRNIFVEQTGAERAVAMLLKKLAGQPFETELPLPDFDHVAPAQPLTELRGATIALVSEGGIVPLGNPDRIEAGRASKWASYPIAGLSSLDPDKFCCVHGGFDNTYANEDPNRIVPLDAMRQLEREGAFGKLHDHFYSTVGNGTTIGNSEQFGREIGQELLAAGVQAVVFTST